MFLIILFSNADWSVTYLLVPTVMSNKFEDDIFGQGRVYKLTALGMSFGIC